MKNEKTICLVMIVKNEALRMPRCLSSIKRFIDTWVIVDTGSTDDTIKVIKEVLDGIPGELYREGWRNFGYNRTSALKKAKGKADYLLLCDADEQIIVDTHKFNRDSLTDDIYRIRYEGNLDYAVPYLISGKLDWEFRGVTHEYLHTDSTTSTSEIKGLSIIDYGDGGSKENKFQRDIELLEQGIIDEPENSRYKFYLANSYKDTENWEKAIHWYLERIKAGGWKEEVTCSYEYLGRCYSEIGDHKSALFYWTSGFDYNPKRAECLYEAGKLCRTLGMNALAYNYLIQSKDIQYPRTDILFIRRDVYEYLIEYELSIVSYYIEQPIEDPRKYFQKLIPSQNCSYENLINNYQFYANPISWIRKTHLDLSEIVSPQDGYFLSTPSFYRDKENPSLFHVNIREVNYKIDQTTGSYLDVNDKPIGKVKSNNINLTLKRDYLGNFKLVDKPKRILSHDEDLRISGLEDIRLYDKDKFIACKWTKDETIRMCQGKRIDNSSYEFTEIKSPYDRKFEKNWSPVRYEQEDLFLYDWDPIQFGKIVDDELEITKTLSKKLRNFRGSSRGVYHDGLYFFVAHVADTKSPRKYYHTIVMFNDSLEYIQHSKFFCLDEVGIEFVLGLDILQFHNELILSYSRWDNSAQIAVYDLHELFQEIF